MNRRFALAQFAPSRRRRAITCAWISPAPSKMLRMRASASTRLTGCSTAKPVPPWIWTALSAAAQAMGAATSLAMPASRSQRRPRGLGSAGDPGRAAGTRQRGRHQGQLVGDAREGGQGLAELAALEGVVEGEVERVLADA